MQRKTGEIHIRYVHSQSGFLCPEIESHPDGEAWPLFGSGERVRCPLWTPAAFSV